MLILKKENQGFPGGPVVKDLSANARYMGSTPDLGRSHMPQSGPRVARSMHYTTTKPVLQSLGAATTETMRPRACALQQGKPLQCEACPLQLESSPCSSKDPGQPNIIFFF